MSKNRLLSYRSEEDSQDSIKNVLENSLSSDESYGSDKSEGKEL
jgi:hypothetical protein